MTNPIYLDNSATTKVAPAVIDAMLPYLSDEIGNASSVHSFGQRAKAAVETARRRVAELIGASPTEIVFVSGGTEADNLAIRGDATAHGDSGRHIVTSVIEHPAVLATCESLEGLGFRVTYLPVSRDGVVDAADVKAAIVDFLSTRFGGENFPNTVRFQAKTIWREPLGVMGVLLGDSDKMRREENIHAVTWHSSDAIWHIDDDPALSEP